MFIASIFITKYFETNTPGYYDPGLDKYNPRLMNRNVQFINLEEKEYKEAWDFQENLLNDIVKTKVANKRLPDAEKTPTSNHLIFCEHPHVYTLGKSGSDQNLLLNYIQLQAKHASFFHTNRGGDITYHGPGQIVGYPIFDLENFDIGLRKYIYLLEEAIILTLKEFGLESSRLEKATGVWLDVNDPLKARKICAIGVKSTRYVTMHGFALNVNTDLEYFQHINPCGFTDKGVTSLEKELGKKLDITAVERLLKDKIMEVFRIEKWLQ